MLELEMRNIREVTGKQFLIPSVCEANTFDGGSTFGDLAGWLTEL